MGIERARPYDLRLAFASLVIHDGQHSGVGQLGHNPIVRFDTSALVMAEQGGVERVGAAELIVLARAARRSDEGGQGSAALTR